MINGLRRLISAIQKPWLLNLQRKKMRSIAVSVRSQDSRPLGSYAYTSQAFYERDPVDLAIDWVEPGAAPIPVIMPANDKRPGGDWEAGM